MSTIATEPPAETPAAPEAGAGRRRLIVVAAALLVLGGGGAGAAWLLAPRVLGEPAPASVTARAEAEVRATVTLGPVVVNLAGDSRRYVRAAISLGVASPKDGKAVEAAKAQITDLLIAVLGEAEADVLLSGDGRAALKDGLHQRIRDDLGLAVVRRVYLTELVVQ